MNNLLRNEKAKSSVLAQALVVLKASQTGCAGSVCATFRPRAVTLRGSARGERCFRPELPSLYISQRCRRHDFGYTFHLTFLCRLTKNENIQVKSNTARKIQYFIKCSSVHPSPCAPPLIINIITSGFPHTQCLGTHEMKPRCSNQHSLF